MCGQWRTLSGAWKAAKPGPFTPASKDSVSPSADERTTRRQEFAVIKSRFLLDRRLRQPCLARFHDEGVVQRVPGTGDIGSGRGSGLITAEITNKVARHAEDDIRFQVVVIVHEYLRDQRFVSL